MSGGLGCPDEATMLRFISRVLAFFRRRVDSSEAEREQHMRLLEGIHFRLLPLRGLHLRVLPSPDSEPQALRRGLHGRGSASLWEEASPSP